MVRLQHALSRQAVTADREKGIIRNVAIISVGEALGHDFQVDRQTLQTVMDAFTANSGSGTAGVKARVSHPNGLIGPDAAMVTVGRPENLRIEGTPGSEAVRGDIRIANYAKRTPVGNLYDWLFDVVEEDPSVLGISIVAGFDFDEPTDPKTGERLARLARATYLHATDFVGDPASNRNGLLSTQGNSCQPPLEGQTMNRFLSFLCAVLGVSQLSEAEGRRRVSELAGVNRQVADILGDASLSKEQADGQVRGLGRDPAKPQNELSTPAPGSQAPGSQAPGSQTPGSQTPAPGSQDNTPAGGSDPGQPTHARPGAERGLGAGSGQQAAGSEGRQPETLSDVQRFESLRAIQGEFSLGEDWFNQQFRGNLSPGEARLSALSSFVRRNPPQQGLGTTVTGGGDGRESLVAGLSDALALRCGVELERPHERAAEFAPMRLSRQFEAYLHGLGVSTVGWGEQRVFETVLDRHRLAEAGLGTTALTHSTADFPKILGNTINKMLLPAYDEEYSTWEQWAGRQVLPDFRAMKMISMGRLPVPERVMEGAEYEHATFGEKYEEIQAFKYGLLLSLTFEMFVNDDLGAFVDGAFGFAQSAKALENDLLYKELHANRKTAEDGKAIFHADHKNLNQGGAKAISKESLNAMRTAMALQRGIDPGRGKKARTLNLRPNMLLVPSTIETETEQLLASRVDPSKANGTPNFKFLSELAAASDSRLDEASTSAYYTIAARRAAAPAAKVAFIRGYERPTMEKMSAFGTVDGVTYKLRHIAGAKILDYRAIQKNEGA